ncbi:MAG TPA: hypothetical protein VGF57_03915 [Roseiarcus sp.]|jgi:hypothetical protein
MSSKSTKFALLYSLATLLVAAPSLAQEKATTIRGSFTETHTMLECDCNPITWTQNFVITLSGKNHIREEWDGRNNNNLKTSSQHESDLGAARGSAIWRVAGPNRLEKTVVFSQHIQKMTITTAGNQCTLDVRFALKPGFANMYVPRADTHEMAHFTLPRTMQTSCEIF